MKTLISLIILLAAIANSGFAQTVNWRSLKSEDKHILNLNAGWDYATTFGIGYGYKVDSRLPLIIGTELSLPAGETLLDDFKAKVGGQAEVFRHNRFSASLKVNGIFRRYQSEFVRLANFGAELSSAIGYYRPRWYAAAEFGFDKAIVTHIRHSRLIEEYYPEIQSGWYIPSGGNFFYGIQMGYSFNKYDVYLKTGKTVTQDFKTKPLIPLYLQVGLNRKF
jgi:hypothetical protein